MDEFFDLTHQKNISVLLDFHRLEKTHQSPVPWNDKYSFDDFLYGWDTILERYSSYDNLKGVDIYNEYQGSDIRLWENVMRHSINHIEERYPNRFDYVVGGYNWASSLNGFDLGIENVIYSIHKYPFQSDSWDWAFGDLDRNIIVGEWGFLSHEIEWGEAFVDYLIEKDIRDTFFWTWSWNSGDTGGILKEDCETVDWDKMNLLRRLWYA
jgi:hypothetical protein